MEKEPLLGELPQRAPVPKSRRILTTIRVLAIAFAASFVACYSWTGYWPLDYVLYSPAERVLIRNPLIGMFLLSVCYTIALCPISLQAPTPSTNSF
jgi:membrane dipeptidase